MDAAAPLAAQWMIPALALILGTLAGMQFPLAAAADFRTVTTTAARIYTADYLGAALGALLVSTLLIPLIGVTAVCLAVAGLNFISMMVIVVTGGFVIGRG